MAAYPHTDDLVDLKLSSGTVTTTEDHPFWNPSDRRWERADALRRGDRVETPTGTASVDGLVSATTHHAMAYDLTVDDLHTYYVVAGHVPVLVHNCDAIVYRALAEGEDPSVGLFARDPSAVDVQPLSHVAGKNASPWISTTKSRDVAFDKYNKGHGVVAIDTRYAMTLEDISNGPFPNSPRHSAYARKDQEVLIWQNVPPEAIVGYWPGK